MATHDNQKSRRAGTVADKERECILCGRCLEVCPLFIATHQEELSPRGKAFLLDKALEQGELGDPATARQLLGLCLGCEQCAQVCPQGRNLPRTLRRLKAEQPGWQSWVWRVWISQARWIWPHLGLGTCLLPQRLAPGSAFAGLKSLADRPRMSAVIRGLPRAARLQGPTVLFPGCVARWAKPWWTQTAQTLLGSADEVVLDWSCCGFTLGQAGLTGPRLDACRTNIALWRLLGRPAVATICATCDAALRGYADEPGLFVDEAESRLWSQAVRPLSALLDPGDFVRIDESRVLYHRPCHAQRFDRGHDPDEMLLRGILGSGFCTSAKGACCGLGGVLRLSAPELSARVGKWYWENVPDPEIRRVVTGCSGCVLQLAASAPDNVVVTHWLDLLGPAEGCVWFGERVWDSPGLCAGVSSRAKK
ncbi:MAG TPA: (Fe-S)-binding protein [Desulfonatronum sp.]|nr:(Fe-S)-binding protein [Desulfonatronum sp.]